MPPVPATGMTAGVGKHLGDNRAVFQPGALADTKKWLAGRIRRLPTTTHVVGMIHYAICPCQRAS